MKIAASSISSSTPLHYEMFANRPALGLFLSRHKDDPPPFFFQKRRQMAKTKELLLVPLSGMVLLLVKEALSLS